MLNGQLALHDKTCKGCGQTKARDGFHTDKNTRDGLRGKCKACVAADNAAWYQRSGKERAKANQRHRIETNPSFRAARKDRMLRTKYGITLLDFREMLAAQDNACAICGSSPKREDLWHVDHNHATGSIRGILCSNCNRGLGYFGDDPTRLLNAWKYLC